VDEHKSVDVLGVYHGHLELQASLSCGDGEALVDYDPTAGTSTVLLGPTATAVASSARWPIRASSSERRLRAWFQRDTIGVLDVLLALELQLYRCTDHGGQAARHPFGQHDFAAAGFTL
jgi:hypothetical protein